MELFNTRQTYLEVDDHYLKVVQLKNEEIIYNETFQLDSKLKEEQLLSYLNQAFYPPSKVSLIIPPTRLFIRTLDLPSTAKDKVEEIIKLQVLTKLPYDPQELYFSYQIIEKAEELLVLVFTTTQEYIKSLYDLCNDSELVVQSILPSSAVFHLIHNEQQTQSEARLYIDLDDNYQHFIFYTADDLYIRASKRAGLVKELEKTLTYLQEEYNLPTPPVVIVNNEKVNHDQLQLLAGTKLNKRNDLFWKKIRVAEKKLKGQDFLSQIPHNNTQQQQRSYRKIWILLILVIVVNGVNFGLQWKMKKRELANLEQNITRVLPTINQINQTKQEYQATSQELELLKSELEPTYGYLPWLKELSLILADEVVIDKITFKENQLILLAGTAPSATEVMSKLEESTYFINLHFIGNIITKDDREEFRIAGDLVDEIK